MSEGKIAYNFDSSKGAVEIKVFEGSSTNLAFNCLDRQIALGRGDKVAIHVERNAVGELGTFQPDSFTYKELRTEATPPPLLLGCAQSPPKLKQKPNV